MTEGSPNASSVSLVQRSFLLLPKVTSVIRLSFWYVLPAYDSTFIMHEAQAVPEFRIGDHTRSDKRKESKDETDKIDPVKIFPAQCR